MKGDPKIIEYLNSQLRNELTAINQYFLHARLYRHWGLEDLGKHEYDESMEEMKHADRLIQRIFMLDGLPNLQDLDKLLVGGHAREVIECDLKLEQTRRRRARKRSPTANWYGISFRGRSSWPSLTIPKSTSTGSRFSLDLSTRSE